MQFGFWAFTQRPKDSGLLPSMGSVGDCYDNSMINAFQSRMQVELPDQRRWHTRVALANAIFEHLEIFHNRQRRHSSLGMLIPIAFENAPTVALGPAARLREIRDDQAPEKAGEAQPKLTPRRSLLPPRRGTSPGEVRGLVPSTRNLIVKPPANRCLLFSRFDTILTPAPAGLDSCLAADWSGLASLLHKPRREVP